MTKIFMLCGLSDIEFVGNQSLKNGIKYLAQFGNQIDVFTFFPDGFRNLQDPRAVFDQNVDFHRLPGILSAVMDWGRRLKNLLGRHSASRVNATTLRPSQVVEYHEEYSAIGRMIYSIFMYLVYVPFECVRVMWFVLSRGKPDLLYGLNCQGAVAAGVIGRLLGLPVVTRFHGTDVSERNLGSRWDRLLLFDQIAGLRVQSRVVIMTNDGTRGHIILQKLGVRHEEIRYWMNGVDTSDLTWPSISDVSQLRAALRLENKRVLLMVSRLAVWKRVERGILCLHAVKNHTGMDDVTLIVIGNGPERVALERCARELGVESSVVFIGGVAHGELSAYFRMADVFLSLYDRTNLGNPLLEAMYFGCSIVTISDGSTDHLLRDHQNAYLVPLHDIEHELPEKVKALLGDPALRVQFGKNVRAAFREQVLSWEQRMQMEHELIQEVLHTSPSR